MIVGDTVKVMMPVDGKTSVQFEVGRVIRLILRKKIQQELKENILIRAE